MSATLTCPCGAIYIVRESVLAPGTYQRACVRCGAPIVAVVV